jgi:hypothetical protein
MKRIAIVGAAVLSSCGLGHAIRPHERATLGAGEGLLVVGSEGAHEVVSRWCADGDRGRCAEVGPTEDDGTPSVYALPAGRYCVMHVRCSDAGRVAEHDVPDDEARCVEVTAQQIAYPGHIVFDRSADSGIACAGRADFLLHDGIDVELRESHPAMGGHATLAPPTLLHPRE